MILDKLGNGGIGCILSRRWLKVDLLIQRAVLLQQLNWVGRVYAGVGTIVYIHAHMDLVLPQPVFLRKLIARQQLELLASPGPPVEEISAPALRCNQHVIQTLAMCIAVEPRVLRNDAENRSGIQLVLIG